VKIVAGLGNPGSSYKDTRHNIGQLVLGRLAEHLATALSRKKFRSLVGTGMIGTDKVLLLAPQTYMNRSGEALIEAVRFFDVAPKDILVIYDDLDLDFGIIKATLGGGAGGHKGIQSIIEKLGSRDFQRIRIGLGRPRYNEVISDYVLGEFYSDEKKSLSGILDATTEASFISVEQGTGIAANKFNGRRVALRENT